MKELAQSSEKAHHGVLQVLAGRFCARQDPKIEKRPKAREELRASASELSATEQIRLLTRAVLRALSKINLKTRKL